MPRESKLKKEQRAIEVCMRMQKLYKDAPCALNFNNAFECVVAVSLSAQTTDVAVNKVTKELFRRWSTPADLAQADTKEVAQIIKSIGFYRNKSRNVVECARVIMSDFGGEVPDTMEELKKLPGVGRKTANIVLNNVFDKVEGIAVDTHVNRIAHKLKLVPAKMTDPNKVEQELLRVIPQSLWKPVNNQWVLFGREFCDAKNPRCYECPLADICPSSPIYSGPAFQQSAGLQSNSALQESATLQQSSALQQGATPQQGAPLQHKNQNRNKKVRLG